MEIKKDGQQFMHALHLDINVKFMALYDEVDGILHIVDDSGENRGFTSVTNAMEKIIPRIEKQFNIKRSFRIFGYGTDKVIAEYHPDKKDFSFVPNDCPGINEAFRTYMMVLYS